MVLLSVEELPVGFRYPGAFLRLVERGIVNIEPWWIFEGELLRDRHRGLASRYPTWKLVPFARRQDNDDVACWIVDGGGQVLVLHDFATPGWERPRVLPDFYSWVRQAVEDMIEFDSSDEA